MPVGIQMTVRTEVPPTPSTYLLKKNLTYKGTLLPHANPLQPMDLRVTIALCVKSRNQVVATRPVPVSLLTWIRPIEKEIHQSVVFIVENLHSLKRQARIF